MSTTLILILAALLFLILGGALAWALHRRALRRLEARCEKRLSELEAERRSLAEASEEATLSSRAKSHFLANMSHEIRTPLTSILGYADLLLRTEVEESVRLKNLRTIRRNGQHLLDLINDVLDISKIEAGEMSVESVRCSPWQLVREVRSLLKTQARSRGLELAITTDGRIPETIQSDPVRLRQILLNLLSNAIKFTDTGSVRVTVQIIEPTAGAGDRARLAFAVADTGIGMSPEQQEGIFDPFRQATAATSRRYGGTGLGLTISRHLARLLGGDITVSSTLGVGTTMTLTVDAGAPDDIAMMDEPVSSESLDAIREPVGKVWTTRLGGRILLAEDGMDNRRFLAAVLQQVGAEVTLAENGEEAVATALAARDIGAPFDTVLMDMQMPVLDGYGAVRHLREAGYDGTIVALTAYAMAGDREKCLAAGCDDFVTKPIDVDRFLESLAKHVRKGEVSVAARPGGTAGKERDTAPTERDTASRGPIRSTLASHPSFGPLVRGFVERLPRRLEELDYTRRSADLETLRSLAHSLRGAGGTYGFQPLTDAARDVELEIARGASRAEVDKAFERLEDACRRVVAEPPGEPDDLNS